MRKKSSQRTFGYVLNIPNNMTWLDIVILIPLLIGLVRGLMRGFVIELTSITAVAIGLICSRLWGAGFALWLAKQFAWPEAVCAVVAYSLLFIGITLVLNIIAKLLSKLFNAIHLGMINRLVGAAFGAGKWAVIVLFVVLCVHRLDDQYHFFDDKLKKDSIVYTYTTPLSEKAWTRAQEQITILSKQLNEKRNQIKDQKQQ